MDCPGEQWAGGRQPGMGTEPGIPEGRGDQMAQDWKAVGMGCFETKIKHYNRYLVKLPGLLLLKLFQV